MLQHSVLRTSGQWWKVLVFFWSLALGSGAILLATHLMGQAPINQRPSQYLFVMLGGGFLVWFFALIFGFAAIRCGACRSRWLWLGARGKLSRDWISLVIDRPECPVCGATNGRKAT